MKTISIYSVDHNSRTKSLIEKWVLQNDGRAALTFCADSEPLYTSCGGVEPANGEQYLSNLLQVISTSTNLDAVAE